MRQCSGHRRQQYSMGVWSQDFDCRPVHKSSAQIIQGGEEPDLERRPARLPWAHSPEAGGAGPDGGRTPSHSAPLRSR